MSGFKIKRTERLKFEVDSHEVEVKFKRMTAKQSIRLQLELERMTDNMGEEAIDLLTETFAHVIQGWDLDEDWPTDINERVELLNEAGLEFIFALMKAYMNKTKPDEKEVGK